MTLSCIISESVGCGKTVWISSSSVVSNFIAMVKPWISSVTSAPTMCAPRSCPVLSVEDCLDGAPVFSERDGFAVAGEREAADSQRTAPRLRFRLGEADAGNLGAASMCSLGCDSFRTGWVGWPAIASTQTTPSCSAL